MRKRKRAKGFHSNSGYRRKATTVEISFSFGGEGGPRAQNPHEKKLFLSVEGLLQSNKSSPSAVKSIHH
ncbi:Hypothetical protein NTJ_12245 [Nesidiocoris tenuis]|uniref:Uncharacterized protein n=1 Tax=Nesidiocoris tenuis TaxID=355587 RepID=A0ABN7B5A2_9HEMI|nr:Hypothetical protein NTJ_12245 [Nesidiocoris tenuis]